VASVATRRMRLTTICLTFRSSKWRAFWRRVISSILGCLHVPGEGGGGGVPNSGVEAITFVGVLGRFGVAVKANVAMMGVRMTVLGERLGCWRRSVLTGQLSANKIGGNLP
jgi:hypothetical protein